MHKLIAYILPLIILNIAGEAYASIYQWKDENGLIHYSDKINRNIEADEFQLKPANVTPNTQHKVRFYPNAKAVTHVSVKKTYYPISGENGADAYSSFKKNGPSLHGQRALAMTHSPITWAIKTTFDKENSQCRVSKAETWLKVTYTYPKWKSRAKASKSMRDSWDRYFSYLEKHEKTHKKIAYKAAKKMARRMAKLQAQSSCALLNVQAKRIYQQELKISRKQQKAYDQHEKRYRHPDGHMP